MGGEPGDGGEEQNRENPAAGATTAGPAGGRNAGPGGGNGAPEEESESAGKNRERFLADDGTAYPQGCIVQVIGIEGVR